MQTFQQSQPGLSSLSSSLREQLSGPLQRISVSEGHDMHRAQSSNASIPALQGHPADVVRAASLSALVSQPSLSTSQPHALPPRPPGPGPHPHRQNLWVPTLPNQAAQPSIAPQRTHRHAARSAHLPVEPPHIPPGAIGSPAQPGRPSTPASWPAVHTRHNPLFHGAPAQQEVVLSVQSDDQLSPQGPGQLHGTPQSAVSPADSSPWQSLPPVKGTLRDVYKGRAAEEWLAKELQKEVDDLAQCVDAFGVMREERLAQLRADKLQKQCDALTVERNALEARVAQLSQLLPEDNGEFKRLKAELLRLEADCDRCWQQLQNELRAKTAAEEIAREMTARFRWLEEQLSRFGLTIAQSSSPAGRPILQQTAAAATAAAKAVPAGPAAAHTTLTATDTLTKGGLLTAAAAAADGVVKIDVRPGVGVGGGDDTLRTTDQGTTLTSDTVTPEAVLAAVAFLRDKGELPPTLAGAYPDRRAVAIRAVILVAILAVVTGAVLITYFLTREFA